MKKYLPVLLAGLLAGCSSLGGGPLTGAADACAQDAVMDGSTWCAITFGQSTDLNFSSTILPAKQGVNHVWLAGRSAPLRVGEAGGITQAVTLEARGGKIANSHDGLTFYYTRLPLARNFRLEALVRVEQFGPEVIVKDALASTNGQESVGLMVRDLLGQPRREPLEVGYEEFPAASNIVANAALHAKRNNEGRFILRSLYRDGVSQPWGDAGAIIPRTDFVGEDAGLQAPGTFRMMLTRSDEGFAIAYAREDGSDVRSMEIKGAKPSLLGAIDQQYQYVGVYAARNARVTFSDIRLSISESAPVPPHAFTPRPEALRFEIASPAQSVAETYAVQARASQDGRLDILQDGAALATGLAVKAGELVSQAARLAPQGSRFEFVFTSADGVSRRSELQVKRAVLADAGNIHAAPDGSAQGDGSQARPLDLPSALQLLAPGGTLTLLPGKYPATTLGIELSGSPAARKKLVAQPGAVFTGRLALNANYWHMRSIEVAGAQFRISGSHNIIERALTYGNDDSGLQISALPKERALWPSHNQVLDSTSHSNRDPSAINADGFAAKLGVGDGNVFRNCLAYDNADDGWDLFNKIEDGANGVVTIEHSYAWNNGNNGFKLGGEGQPVAHAIRHSAAFHNGLDGFTDNFNPGALVVENNVAFDNARFNYIFRPSPYGGSQTQGRFSGNLSLRTNYAGKYDDAVVGVIGAGNAFIRNGASPAKTADFISTTPALPLARKADGSVEAAGFLQRR